MQVVTRVTGKVVAAGEVEFVLQFPHDHEGSPESPVAHLKTDPKLVEPSSSTLAPGVSQSFL